MSSQKNASKQFCKMYNWILEAKKLTANERLILAFISSFCEKNKTAVVSLNKLSKMMARSTAQSSLASLVEKKLIVKGKTFKYGTHYKVAHNLIEVLVEKYGPESRYLPVSKNRVPDSENQYGDDCKASDMVPESDNSKDIKEKKNNRRIASFSSEDETPVPSEQTAQTGTKNDSEYYDALERAVKEGWF